VGDFSAEKGVLPFFLYTSLLEVAAGVLCTFFFFFFFYSANNRLRAIPPPCKA